MKVEEDSVTEQQIEELTKKDNKSESGAAKLAQQLEQMQGPTGSKDRPQIKELPTTQGLL